jgi:hypothetical protein
VSADIGEGAVKTEGRTMYRAADLNGAPDEEESGMPFGLGESRGGPDVSAEGAVTPADVERALTQVPKADVDIYTHLLHETEIFAGAAPYLTTRAAFLETAAALIKGLRPEAGKDIPRIGLTGNKLIEWLEESREVGNKVKSVLRDIELAADFVTWNPAAKANDAEVEDAKLAKATEEEMKAAVRVMEAQLKSVEKVAAGETEAPSGEVRSALFKNLGIKEIAGKDELATILSKGKKRLSDIKKKFGK